MDSIKQHRWVICYNIPAKLQKNEDGFAMINMAPLNPMTIQIFPHFIMCWDCHTHPDEGWGNPCWADPNEALPDGLWEPLK